MQLLMYELLFVDGCVLGPFVMLTLDGLLVVWPHSRKFLMLLVWSNGMCLGPLLVVESLRKKWLLPGSQLVK